MDNSIILFFGGYWNLMLLLCSSLGVDEVIF